MRYENFSSCREEWLNIVLEERDNIIREQSRESILFLL